MAEIINAFRITPPLRGYDDTFDQLVGAVPAGDFYDHSRPLVMWSAKPNRLLLYTDNFNVPVKIKVERIGDYKLTVNPSDIIEQVSIVPVNGISTFSISLGKGKNRITAVEEIEGGRTSVVEVIASTNTLFFESMGKESFRSIGIVNEQQQALYSKYSTRMLDQVVQFQDLLPANQSLKILATKLLIRSAVHFPARAIGVRNLIETFALNTPVLQSQRESSTFHTERSRIQRAAQNSAGQEAHVWFPNLSVTRWAAFTRMADSLKQNYDIVSVKDDTVEVVYKNSNQVHQFDFDQGTNFITNLSLTNCFSGIEVFAQFKIKSSYIICCWSYPFDTTVTREFPIGLPRGSFDLGIPFDSGYTFDADPVDPWIDGWVGWSLDGRFDMEYPGSLALDSSISPALGYSGSQCVYTRGPYTQLFNSTGSEIDIETDFTILDPPPLVFWNSYSYGPIVALEMDFPLSGPGSGTLVAGTAYNVVLKYADANHMTNATISGTSIAIQESNGGTLTNSAPTNNGYIATTITPTIAGPAQSWDLSEGPYLGTSITKNVIAGPFAAFNLSVIPNQSIGTSFMVSVQAVDAYGNNVTEVGISNKVNVSSLGGFIPSSAQPLYFDLVDGFATATLTMSSGGTGHLDFLLGAVTTSSNTFTVT